MVRRALESFVEGKAELERVLTFSQEQIVIELERIKEVEARCLRVVPSWI